MDSKTICITIVLFSLKWWLYIVKGPKTHKTDSVSKLDQNKQA